LIQPIGQWVLETACAQLKAWEADASTRDLVLAINVSPRQFGAQGFVNKVESTLLSSGIAAARLKLEITESMLLHNVENVISTMRQLKALGVSFSMDDFGTGYSSLQYLKRLPLDQIKIDQSFVRDITIDRSDQEIVRTIIAMAQSMNLSIIAEGVETEQQRQLIANRGCTNYQGFLFGRPVPIEEFETLLRQK
jgi:EAL domain-containing protein (putative c-di-GMP-specific phosphodiesterase class I)